MSKFISKYQCAIFGNFDEIAATPEVVKFFFERFMEKQLIPTQFQEQTFAVSNREVKHQTLARISLKSFDQKFEIKFLSERCDFIYNDWIFDDSYSLNNFIDEVKNCLSIITQKYPRKYNRIGLVQESFSEQIDVFNSSRDFNNPIELFKDEKPVEWTNKFVVRKKNDVLNEPFNLSLDNSYINGEIILRTKRMQFNGIRSIIDINTLAEDNSERFNYDSICSFLDSSEGILKTIDEQNSDKIK